MSFLLQDFSSIPGLSPLDGSSTLSLPTVTISLAAAAAAKALQSCPTLCDPIGKDPDARKDWGQEERGTTEDEMAGWHH